MNEPTNKKKLYEVTVSFCVYAKNENEAWELGNSLTDNLATDLAKRDKPNEPTDENLAFFHIDEPQEVKF